MRRRASHGVLVLDYVGAEKRLYLISEWSGELVQPLYRNKGSRQIYQSDQGYDAHYSGFLLHVEIHAFHSQTCLALEVKLDDILPVSYQPGQEFGSRNIAFEVFDGPIHLRCKALYVVGNSVFEFGRKAVPSNYGLVVAFQILHYVNVAFQIHHGLRHSIVAALQVLYIFWRVSFVRFIQGTTNCQRRLKMILVFKCGRVSYDGSKDVQSALFQSPSSGNIVTSSA
jgi:hypothetical protein